MNHAFSKAIEIIRRQGWGAFLAKVKGQLAYYLDPRLILYRSNVAKILNEKDVGKRFQIIYEKNLWESEESLSGHGSTLLCTENIRKKLPEIFQKYSVQSIFDAPCGDFNWMRHVVKDCPALKYQGGDIVRAIAESNQSRHANDRISFQHFDITRDPIPDCDLMMVRDCLIHLSFEDISRFLENFSKSNVKFLLTTTYIGDDSIENIDILSGNFRPIDLFSAPFFFPNKNLEALDDWIPPHHPHQLVLFAKKDVPISLHLKTNPDSPCLGTSK